MSISLFSEIHNSYFPISQKQYLIKEIVILKGPKSNCKIEHKGKIDEKQAKYIVILTNFVSKICNLSFCKGFMPK